MHHAVLLAVQLARQHLCVHYVKVFLTACLVQLRAAVALAVQLASDTPLVYQLL